MAFNPFTTFRKNQKYWMAGAILICMTTFVLCSGGIQGTGLDDRIYQWFGGRRSEYLNINGRSYTFEEINQLKNQRSVANDFMRDLANTGIKRLTEQIKNASAPDKKDESFRFQLSLAKTCLTDLHEKLQRDPHYFRGGVKLEALVDFILWRDLARKYDLSVTDDVVKLLVDNACHGRYWGFDSDISAEAEARVGYTHHATRGTVFQAVKQEFTVQIAQLALATQWSRSFWEPGYQKYQRDRLADLANIDRLPSIYLNTPMHARIAPTPEQMNASYRKNRTELTIELLPVSLEVLAKKVELPADPQARLETLKAFYDKYAKNKYDPNLETPGFLFPERGRIQILAADASMEYYQQPAKAASILQKFPPTAFNPFSPLTGALEWVAAEPAWRASLEQNAITDRLSDLTGSDEQKKAAAKVRDEYQLLLSLPPHRHSASPLITPIYYSPGQYNLALENPAPSTAASFVAGSSGGPWSALAAYQGGAFDSQAKKIAPMAEIARPHRGQVGGELVMANLLQLSGGGPFTVAGLTYYAGNQQQYLPVAGFIEDELRAKIEDRVAQRWVNGSDDKDKGYGMLFVKKKLEGLSGKSAAFANAVHKLRENFTRTVTGKDGKTRTISGFVFGESADRNVYDIEFDEALKPLRDSFDHYRITVNLAEGRAGKPELLREGDFNKLFFGSEPLGVGGSAELYVPKAWPPNTFNKARTDPLAAEAKLLLFDKAEKPVLFWKSAKRGPESLPWRPEDPIMLEFVEKQYRLQAARADLMAEVKKIADEVKTAQRSETVDLATAMAEIAKRNGTEIVTLNKVAFLVNNPSRRAEEPAYVEYELPRFKISMHRPDMVQQLLSLHKLAAPLKIESDEFKDLNEINKTMFSADLQKSAKAKVGQVQILTNKPRSIYYIATVSKATEPGDFGFFEALGVGLTRDRLQGLFVDQVREDLGKELFREMALYLRQQAAVTYSQEAEKHKAEEPPGL